MCIRDRLRGILGTFDKDQDLSTSKMSFEEILRCFNEFVLQSANSDEKYTYTLDSNERMKNSNDIFLTINDPADPRRSIFQELASSPEAKRFLVERLIQLQQPR
eukprot:TRINITY_DN5669_c0_g1_i1.p1 TRINITY_DN5669_c0_g1~~TRINITY_DN5669_c0_g1_i1.p1  ORF type:complete len:104 (-),score=18.14 TRINITY_DN5669_c0_g1_i1:237-548(-)